MHRLSSFFCWIKAKIWYEVNASFILFETIQHVNIGENCINIKNIVKRDHYINVE